MSAAAGGERKAWPLMLGAIGVVFGDIGTSVLYTIREVFSGRYGIAFSPENIMGVCSLVFWALVIVVLFKYIFLMMRADNRGEGGILALTALVSRGLEGESHRLRWWVVGLGIFGAAMLYGDGMITPAISVLSAVEGLQVMAPQLQTWVMPLALAILIGLFSIQKFGTARVGRLFGPVCLVWFIVIGGMGIMHIVQSPRILQAIDPRHAAYFIGDNPIAAFVGFGAIVLAVTGTEALYADMGHFGRDPLRRAWILVVMPALVLNYFGQGALLLNHPAAIANPFYLMVPQWALLPLVILATCATVVASQAMISGAFSITRQAVQMGYCPRLNIQHTSEAEIGQIYVPMVNWTLFVGVCVLVIGFRHSSALAGAYGIAVTMGMLIDTILIFVVMIKLWRWPLAAALAVVVPLGIIDLAFATSNALKIPNGGWFPLLIGIIVFTLLTTWKRGRILLMQRLSEDAMPLDLFVPSIEASPPTRVPGTAVFLTSTPDQVPLALLHNLKHNKVLHERVVFLTVVSHDVPYVDEEHRIEVSPLGADFYRMYGNYGFKEDPDVPALLGLAGRRGFAFDMMDTSFFVSRETLIPTRAPGMALWREKVFVSMSKNAVKASEFFRVPSNRVVELGTQIKL